MTQLSNIKPISYLKANAAQVMNEIQEQRMPMVITQNGEAKAVIQSVSDYERTQETMALLKVLALGKQQLEEGKVKSAKSVIDKIRRSRS
jgi:prevent-host-death family protein